MPFPVLPLPISTSTTLNPSRPMRQLFSAVHPQKGGVVAKPRTHLPPSVISTRLSLSYKGGGELVATLPFAEMNAPISLLLAVRISDSVASRGVSFALSWPRMFGGWQASVRRMEEQVECPFWMTLVILLPIKVVMGWGSGLA